MEVYNSGTVRFSLAGRCLLATAVVVALISCRGARATSEAGNATIPRQCHGGECLIAYQQPEVELTAVLDPEHGLGSMLENIAPGKATGNAANRPDLAGCGRQVPGKRYTPCPPKQNAEPPRSPYYRAQPK